MISYPIRILHVIGIMNRGGAETMIMNLYRKIDRTKVQFDFVEHTNNHAVFDDEILKLGGRIYNCPKYNGKNHIAYKKWWNEFCEEHADEYTAVHGHIGSTAAIYLKITKKYGLYTIAHSHSSGSARDIKSILYKIMSYNTRNIADYFFTCSEAAGMDRYGKKVVMRTDKYSVLNNAIDVDEFIYNEETRIEVRNDLNFKDDEFVIGHIGRFTQEKNHKFILEIFSEYLKNGFSGKLILIGDGPLRDKMELYAKTLEIENSVSFLGVRSDVNELLQAMDVLLFPSLFEGLPVTLVEAQASGLPCIISDVIPKDTILSRNLINMINLKEDISKWVEVILSKRNLKRENTSEIIKKAGFDINQTAKWLEEFYVSKAK